MLGICLDLMSMHSRGDGVVCKYRMNGLLMSKETLVNSKGSVENLTHFVSFLIFSFIFFIFSFLYRTRRIFHVQKKMY